MKEPEVKVRHDNWVGYRRRDDNNRLESAFAEYRVVDVFFDFECVCFRMCVGIRCLLKIKIKRD